MVIWYKNFNALFLKIFSSSEKTDENKTVLLENVKFQIKNTNETDKTLNEQKVDFNKRFGLTNEDFNVTLQKEIQQKNTSDLYKETKRKTKPVIKTKQKIVIGLKKTNLENNFEKLKEKPKKYTNEENEELLNEITNLKITFEKKIHENKDSGR